MVSRFYNVLIFMALALAPLAGLAEANLEINTPAIASLKQSMQSRHAQLVEHYNSGAVGLTRDGMVAVRDANAVPLAQRQAVNALVSAENQDRAALYREIARANNHPEWESKIRATFGQRWVNLARSGWWYQADGSVWKQK
ncbi:MAG: YdbL family protein [Nitrosomonas sp.]|jgi:uncharacterized protein YdbL (DUF1318 family)|nr:YdbL family protein [Nitrosomonas sp.]